MKILHITNWYPSDKEPKRALWIKDQISLLNGELDYEVWHLEVINGFPGLRSKVISETENSLILSFPAKKWFLIEILSAFLLAYLLFFRIKLKEVSHLHFHIAYPLLTYWRLFALLVKKQILVSEHWSAYHYDFHIRKRKKLKRIQRIFFNDIRLLAVSRSLAQDIVRFSENRDLKFSVIPNVVDVDFFKWSDSPINRGTFFMLSQWKDPKDPFTIIELMRDLNWFNLRIGGYGPQLEKMKGLIADLGLEDRVVFLGVLDKDSIIKEFTTAFGFIHSSDYETFSVVCAEAICCGCPVIASNVGGIPDFINSSNGVLVDRKEEWKIVLERFRMSNFPREQISSEARAFFDRNTIKEKLINLYEKP